jgi:hypothetical protein
MIQGTCIKLLHRGNAEQSHAKTLSKQVCIVESKLTEI